MAQQVGDALALRRRQAIEIGGDDLVVEIGGPCSTIARMDGNWRHGVAGMSAGILCAVILSAAFFLPGLEELLTAYGQFFLRFGDIGIVGMIPLALGVVFGPALLWYGLTILILRLLGERD